MADIKITLLFLLAIFALIPLSVSAGEPLNIAVAANVRNAFDELAVSFREETGIDVTGIFASSGKLATQIRSGAPFDVFLSADMEFPKSLYQDGYAVDPPAVYAYGTLVLWTMTDLDLSQGVSILTDPKVIKVAYANPKLAPYGQAAVETLTHYRIAEAIQAKAVFGENISQVNQYIHSRNVDAGFTAKSAVLSPEMRGAGKWVEVPKDTYQPIAQGVVMLKHGRDNALADCRRFLQFLASAPARAILTNYGYDLP